jgi:hypothetical protein
VGWETERETIQRETKTQRESRASWNQDVIVPAGQSLLIAAGVGVGAFVLAVLVTVWRSWPFWAPLAAAGGLGGVSFAASIVLLVLDHRRLLWAAERALDVDLDHDGVTGEPEQPRRALQVELLEDHGSRQRLSFIDLPGSDAQLVELARGVLNGKGTSESEWTGSGNPFSRSEFGALRAALIKRGLAHWINPDAHSQGWKLTAAGRAVMQRIAEMNRTALPRGGNGRAHVGRGVRARARAR